MERNTNEREGTVGYQQKNAKYKGLRSRTGHTISGKHSHFLSYSGYLREDFV